MAGRTLQPEDEISHYRVVGPLGAGGMGEVYLAQDQTLERNVALKILPHDLVRSEERVRRFVLEAKSASSLSHPNIVTIYEIGQDRVRPGGKGATDSAPVHFISMELVSGKTLSTVIHEDKTDLRTLLGYLAQAAEGLAKAHAAGIVHRDLKPGNIMVSADGFTKVLDFGLAKLTERREGDADLTSAPTVGPDATSAGAVLGTAGYMSPEQVQGKSVDHRSDIFSFGCILYEATTRQRPFSAESGVETMHRILHDKPVPVEELNPKAPAELRRLIRRCLAKSLDQRLQSMKDLAIELREIVEEFEALSASASSGSGGAASMPAAKGTRRLPVVPIAVGAVLVAAAGIAIAVWGVRRGAREEGKQPFQSMRMSVQTSRGDVTYCSLSGDGRYLAYVSGSAFHTGLRVKQVATGSDVEIVPPAEALIESPSFTPDGNYIFYRLRKRDAPSYSALYQVPSLGGPSRQRAFDVDSRATFSPDGKRICFRRGIPQKRMDALFVMDLDSGQERMLASVMTPQTYDADPQWSPDGKRIAAAVADPVALQSTFVMYRPQDGHREDHGTLQRTFIGSIAWLPDGSGLASSATDLAASVSQQIWLVSLSGGRLSRITNDLNDYSGVSTSSGDEALAAVRFSRLSNLWRASVAGEPAHQITNITSSESSPFNFVTADRGFVLYAAPHDQSVQLWSADAAGSAPRAVTPAGGYDLDVRSRAGRVVSLRIGPGGEQQLWSMDVDGGRRKLLAGGSIQSLTDLSRDGRFATFIRRDSMASVWIVPLEGGEPSLLASGAAVSGGWISRDGRQVLIIDLKEGEGGLIRVQFRVVPVGGGEATATVIPPAQFNDLEWGPDGASVTVSDRADSSWNLYRYPLDGGTPLQLTHFREGQVTSMEWSPDGSQIAVARKIGAIENVWITAADGSRPAQITKFTTGSVFGLHWTADGRGVVVSQGTTSQDAVLIRDFR